MVSEGGVASLVRMMSSSGNGFGIGGLDSLNRLSSLHHVSISPRVHR